MDPKTVIRQSIAFSENVCSAYLADLSDEDLLHRPVEGANHINWQLGHLIASENMLAEMVKPGAMPDLPEGFSETYTKETASIDDPGHFLTKDQLLEVHRQQRDGLMAILDGISDEELETPSPEKMASLFPNSASLIMSADMHWMMHAGQWAVVRRSLGRDPLF